MNRRNFLQTTGKAAAGTAAGALVLSTEACNKDALTWSLQVVNAFEQAQPIIADLLPGSVALIAKAITIARQLQKALKDKSADAITFLKELIAPAGLVNQIADTLHLIQGPAQRRILSGILALASIGLSLIASDLEQQATPAIKAGASRKDRTAVDAIQATAESDRLEQALKALRF